MAEHLPSELSPEEQPENLIDTSLLDVNRTPDNMSADDIYNYTPPGYQQISGPELKTLNVLNKYYAGPSTGALAESTYFPGFNESINKGTYGGQTFSAPVFAAGGGLFPFGVVDARKKAMEAAAFEKAKQLRAFDVKPLETKNKFYQDKLNESYFNETNKYIKEAKAYYGDNWRYALTDFKKEEEGSLANKFQKTLRTYSLFKDQINQLTDVVAGTLKESEDPEAKKYLTPESVKLAKDIQNAMGEFGGGKIGQQDIPLLANKLGGERALIATVRQSGILDKIKPQILDTIGQIGSGEDYDTWKTKTEKTYENQISSISKQLKDQSFGASDYITTGKISEYLKSILGDEVSEKIQFARKAKPEGGAEEEYSAEDIQNNQPSNLEVQEISIATGLPTGKTVKRPFTYANKVQHKGIISVKLSLNTQVIDINENKRETEAKAVDIKTGETGVVPIYKEGTKNFKGQDISGLIVPDDAIEKNKGAYEYKVMTTGTYEEAKGNKKITKTVVFPSEQAANALQKEKQGKKRGVPLDILQKQADALNAPVAAPKAEQKIESTKVVNGIRYVKINGQWYPG